MSSLYYRTYTVTEGSSARISVSFYDADGVLARPTTIFYKLVDAAGTELIGSTEITPTDTTVEIIIPAAKNTIAEANEASAREQRTLVVTSTYSGTSETRVDPFSYYVTNVLGV